MLCNVKYKFAFYRNDGEEYTGSESSVIISSQISDGFMTFLGNSSVILNFIHNVSIKPCVIQEI